MKSLYRFALSLLFISLFLLPASADLYLPSAEVKGERILTLVALVLLLTAGIVAVIIITNKKK